MSVITSRRVGAVILSAAVATGIGAPAAFATPAGIAPSVATINPTGRDATAEQSQLYSLLAATRADNNLTTLTVNTDMERVAAAWAQKMAENADAGAGNAAMVHSNSNPDFYFATHIPGGYTQAAENIGFTSQTPAVLHQAWLNSAPHRATIMTDRYETVGIGIAYDSRGYLWAVSLFADYNDGTTTPTPVTTPDPVVTTPAPAPDPTPVVTVDPTPVPVVTTPVVTTPVVTTPPNTGGGGGNVPVTTPVTGGGGGGGGNVPVTTPTPIKTDKPVVTKAASVAGTDRYDTSIQVARMANKSRTIVVVNGNDNSVDSLAGGPLAASLNAGLVLTGTNGLPQSVKDYIRTDGVDNAIVLGGENVVSDSVVQDLKASGVTGVQRIAGRDRYETSVLVSQQPSLRDSQTVIVSGGTAIPDAVSAGGVAGYLKAPVVLVPKEGTLPNDGLYNTVKSRGNIVVTGSAASVSDNVAAQLGADVRLGGVDRYDTSLKIAQWATGVAKVPATQVSVTTAEGAKLADALSAAALGHVTLLTRSNEWGSDITSFLSNNKTEVVYTIGGQTPSK